MSEGGDAYLSAAEMDAAARSDAASSEVDHLDATPADTEQLDAWQLVASQSDAAQISYLYPGQGTQKQGMTLDEATHDAVLAEIWQQADEHTRAVHGFSIRQIVADNPVELEVADELLRHPTGLLHRTEFSQAALAVVAYAQTEQLRLAGKLVEGAWFAGHSLGEYTALACYGQVLGLTELIDVVYQRGRVMNQLVPRDEQGASDYGIVVLRPDRLGLDEAETTAYVTKVGVDSGEFLEVVNHNLAGAQYAVAGSTAGLAALTEDAKQRTQAAGTGRAVLRLPGIDVPFHSSVLRPGVDEFRASLQRIVPEGVDCTVLLGRYVPNLVGIPFALDEDFLAAVKQAAPAAELPSPQTVDPRTLLIELLAWQFASPVQWIKTQETLLDAEVQRFVEIGLAESPVLTNLLTATLNQPRHVGRSVEVLNLQRDRVRILN